MKKLKCVQKHVKLKYFACSLVAFAAKLLECKSYLINSRGVRPEGHSFIYNKRSATRETNKQMTTAKQVSNFSQEHTCAIVYIKQVMVIIILSPFAQNLGKEYQTQSAPHHWIPLFYRQQ